MQTLSPKERPGLSSFSLPAAAPGSETCLIPILSLQRPSTSWALPALSLQSGFAVGPDLHLANC